ncbi:MAG: hypothetical protein JO142_19670, partial [Burkholderiales bacterium]|nr:hypothetical protein [Burkholderiales bacterium]
YWVFNDIYYRQFGPDYVIVEPPVLESVPTATVVPSPPASPPQIAASDLFAYPRNGQSEQQQAKDRYECHAWAVKQTGYDPTQPLGGVSQDMSLNKRAEYQRATTACLEGRGYTVR